MARLLLAAFLFDVLVVSSATKFRNRASFLDALRSYRMFRSVGERVLAVLSSLIPLAEGLVAALLVVASAERVGALAALALFLGFYIVIVNEDRPTFRCGCAGGPEVPAPRGAFLARNLVLVGAAAALAVLSLWGAPHVRRPLIDTAVAVGLMLPFALLALESPLIVHLVAVDRKNMPARLARVRGGPSQPVTMSSSRPSPIPLSVGGGNGQE